MVKFATMFKFIVEFIEVIGHIMHSHNFKGNMQIMHAMFNMEIVEHLNFLIQGKYPLAKNSIHLSYQNEVSLEIVGEDFEFYFN